MYFTFNNSYVIMSNRLNTAQVIVPLNEADTTLKKEPSWHKHSVKTT